MRVLSKFLRDESGFVLSSEMVLVGTLGVVGATVGLSAAARSVNDELTEMAFAIRSLDQSYSYQGFSSGTAWTAGSEYTQPPVEESLAALREQIERDREAVERGAPEDPSEEETPRRRRRPRTP